MNSKSLRTVETETSLGALKDMLEQRLYQIGHIHDDERLVKLTIGDLKSNGDIPIKFTVTKNKEVKVIVHNAA